MRELKQTSAKKKKMQLDTIQLNEEIPNPLIISKFVGHETAPKWTVYPYIYTKYRSSEYYCTRLRCLKSLFELHTETMNAWTMIFASIFSTACFAFAKVVVGLREVDHAVFFLFLLSTLLHCPWSVGYHLCMPISPAEDIFWRQMDTGAVFSVSVLLSFSFSYYVFPYYVTIIVVLLSFVTALIGIREVRKWKPGSLIEKTYLSRIIMSAVFLYSLPLLWQIICNLKDNAHSSTASIVCAFSSLAIGCVLFDNSIPQCYFPGKFTVFFTSHQLMHFFLITANISEFMFLVIMKKSRSA